jgi:hypothetical protein
VHDAAVTAVRSHLFLPRGTLLRPASVYSNMYVAVAQLPSDLFGAAFTIALVLGALLLLGGLVSFAVFAYRSVRGEGMRDPREVVPEEAGDEGDSDDEWDYY